jgi:oligopeptide/dipeptide ABC transporter ATP-binding protein
VLDEPTTALDPLAQRGFLDLILAFQRERGLGFLWITHDLGVAAEVCQRLLVVYGGASMEAGPTEALLAAPRHPYTARLLDAARRQPASEAGFLPAPQERPAGCPFQPRCPPAQTSCATWGPWQGTASAGLRCERPLEPPGPP